MLRFPTGKLRYKLKVDSKGRILLPREARSELSECSYSQEDRGGIYIEARQVD